MSRYKLEPILMKIPLFSGIALSSISIKQLSGLTNQNFLLSILKEQKTQYVLRIPHESTNSNINRSNEAFNEEIAQSLGLAPQILWQERNEHSELTGVSLHSYLANSATLTVNRTNNLDNPKIFNEVAISLKVLQSSRKSFKGIVDHQTTTKFLNHYFSLCTSDQQSVLQQDYYTALQLLKVLDDEIKPSNRLLVPSHIDLVLENILVDNPPMTSTHGHEQHKIWFIDWEYSAMASPFWDIATLCNAAELSDDKAASLLRRVLTHCYGADVVTLNHYRAIVKTVSDCWLAAYPAIPHIS